jgi:ketosteroid isomerase-like protein
VNAFTEDGTIDFSGRSPRVPWHLPVRGHAELPRFFAVFARSVEVLQFERLSTVASETSVVSRVHLRYRVRATGRIIDEHQVHWWTLDDGRVQAMTHFEDTAQVIDAVTRMTAEP